MSTYDIARPTIVDLPNEILHLILDLSRPNDFEPTVLACKTLYHAAGDLVEKHNICRRRLRKIFSQQRDDPVKRYITVKDGFQFMEELFDHPIKLICDQLRYFTHMILKFPPYHRPQSLHHSTQSKLGEFPGLALSLREMGRDYWLFARINGSDEVNPKRMLNELSRPMILAPWPVHYRPSFLQLFHNVQSLILDGEFITGPDDLAREFAPLIEAHVLFQQLEEILYTNARNSIYKTISPILALPRLRTLMADEFDQPGFPSPKDSNLDDRTSSIELIALFRASLQPYHIEKLLQRYACLHTFLWEDYTDAPTYDSVVELVTYDDFDRAPYEDGLKELLGNRTGQIIPFNDELDADCAIGEPPEWLFDEEDTEPPFLFKPIILLKLLERTHADDLRHLAFTIRKSSERFPLVPIRRSFKVLHFLTFQNLTYLEFDIHVLHPRKDSHTAYPSLTNVLPKSLQALRLIVSCFAGKGSEILGELLDSFPDTREDFPHLKDIIVKRRVNVHYTLNLWMGEQTEISLESLRTRFQEMDVTFRWEVVRASYNFWPKVDWIKSSNIIDKVEVMDRWM